MYKPYTGDERCCNPGCTTRSTLIRDGIPACCENHWKLGTFMLHYGSNKPLKRKINRMSPKKANEVYHNFIGGLKNVRGD